MKCAKCSGKAVVKGLCREHFVKHFEKKVYGAISEFQMIKKGDSVCVGVSGGKDSMVMLDILSRKYSVSALAIDEGIQEYREHTLEWLRKYCSEHSVPLKVLRFRQPLDSLRMKHACTECGIRRRELLNKGACGFDVLAIGHNLDDTAQTIVMNLFKNTTDMMSRALPVSSASDKYVRRVKPLYWCTEKEVLLYAVLCRLAPDFVECPYMKQSFRNDVRKALNKHSVIEKKNIVKKYLSLMGK